LDVFSGSAEAVNLAQKATKGVMWSGASQFAIQGLQLIVKVILARLLFPEAFGVLGMALIFTAFVQTINDLGLSAAVVQRKDISERHLSTAFWMSILTGVILCIIGAGSSPLIASFFGEDLLKLVVRVLSLGFILGSFGVVHRALLMRSIDFKSIAFTEIGAAIFSGVASISLALSGFGIWSLVAGSLMGALARSVLLWTKSHWRPSILFDVKAFKELFGFGKNVMGSRILNYMGSNVDYLLIGKFLSASALGVYTLAFQMAIFPLSKISSVITRVTFPTFSSIQDNNARLRQGYLKAIKYTSLATFPLLAGLAVVAPRFIPLVIGEKWLPVVTPLQILCVAGALKSIGTHVGAILRSKGRPDIELKWNIFTAIILPVAILISVKHGVIAVAIAVSVMSCVLFLIIQKIMNRLIDLGFYQFFRALYPATLCSIILIVSILVFRRLSLLISLQALATLGGSIATGGFTYLLAIYVLDNNSVKEIKVLIKEMRQQGDR